MTCYYAKVYMFQLNRESSTKRFMVAFYPAAYVMIVYEQVKGLSQKRYKMHGSSVRECIFVCMYLLIKLRLQ